MTKKKTPFVDLRHEAPKPEMAPIVNVKGLLPWPPYRVTVGLLKPDGRVDEVIGYLHQFSAAALVYEHYRASMTSESNYDIVLFEFHTGNGNYDCLTIATVDSETFQQDI